MIAGEVVSLRPLDRGHVERTRAWANDPELGRLLDRARPVSEMEHEQWFARMLERSDCVYFAIESREGRHVGNVWLWDIDSRHRRAELRIVVGEASAQGRGLGREAIALMCQYGFERLNLHRIYAYVLDINPRAKHAFEKAGFTVEGVLRADRWIGDRYCDVFVLGRIAEHS